MLRPDLLLFTGGCPRALAQELRQLPLEEAIRKAGQQRGHPLLVSKHAVGLCSCVLALRATQMGHCFMAVDAIEF